MSAVATVVPSASFSWAVSFSPLAAAWPVPPPSPPPCSGDADGDVEPVQTDGVVPGCVATGSFGLQAHNASAGTANMAAAAAVLSMCKSLTGDRHDHARRLIYHLGDPRRHRRLEELAHLVGGFPLTRSLTEVHRGLGQVR